MLPWIGIDTEAEWIEVVFKYLLIPRKAIIHCPFLDGAPGDNECATMWFKKAQCILEDLARRVSDDDSSFSVFGCVPFSLPRLGSLVVILQWPVIHRFFCFCFCDHRREMFTSSKKVLLFFFSSVFLKLFRVVWMIIPQKFKGKQTMYCAE